VRIIATLRDEMRLSQNPFRPHHIDSSRNDLRDFPGYDVYGGNLPQPQPEHSYNMYDSRSVSGMDIYQVQQSVQQTQSYQPSPSAQPEPEPFSEPEPQESQVEYDPGFNEFFIEQAMSDFVNADPFDAVQDAVDALADEFFGDDDSMAHGIEQMEQEYEMDLEQRMNDFFSGGWL